MERARDTGEITVSEILKFRTSTDKTKEYGFVVYLPTYAEGTIADSVASRRDAFTGVVSGAFRAVDLMSSVSASSGRGYVFDIFNVGFEGKQSCFTVATTSRLPKSPNSSEHLPRRYFS